MIDFYNLRDLRHYLLLPIAGIYSSVLFLREKLLQKKSQERKLFCPVICVGNAVMGGAGKTPMVQYLAGYFQKKGKRVHIISRGYGRRRSGNFTVQAEHTVHDVGDEAMVLAKDFLVWVADDRHAVAEMAVNEGAEILLLDDGYQDISLPKSLHILVTDIGFGYGNGFVFPAGPLREPLYMSFNRADCHVLLKAEGDESVDYLSVPNRAKEIPQISVELSLLEKQKFSSDTGDAWIVFCGLARPEKFFATARKLAEMQGVHIMGYRSFQDHHFYSSADKRELWKLAEEYGARLVTSEKDFMRFDKDEREDLSVITVEITCDEAAWDSFFTDKNLL